MVSFHAGRLRSRRGAAFADQVEQQRLGDSARKKILQDTQRVVQRRVRQVARWRWRRALKLVTNIIFMAVVMYRR
jgi:hypothetical protein